MKAYPKFIFSTVCSILLGGSLLTTSCGGNYSAASNQLPQADAKPGVIVNQPKSESKTVTFEGVTVTYEEALKTSISPDQTKDSPLENETDKPDLVAPGHVVFKFEGEYGEKFKNSFFSPELHIYPIREYRKQFAVSKEEVAGFDRRLAELDKFMAAKKTASEAEVPYLNFIDAEQTLAAKIKFTDFAGGEGVWFLTQYNIEPSLINNEGLTYVFQGISRDKKYYVLATFPVSLGSLPENFRADKTETYERPDKIDDGRNDGYQNYLLDLQKKLDSTPAGDFSPNLQYFEKIIGSMKLEASFNAARTEKGK